MEATREDLLGALKKADEANDKIAMRAIAKRLDKLDKSQQAPEIDPEAMVKSQAKIGPGTFIKEAMKQGVTETPAFLAAVPEALYGKVTGQGDFLPQLGQNFKRNQEAAQGFLQDMGIFDEPKYSEAQLRAADPSGGYLYSGTKALADPLAVAGPLVKGGLATTKAFTAGSPMASVTADALGTLGRTSQASLTSGVAGVTGEMGGQIGQQLGGDVGGLTGALVGGAVAPSITAPISSGVVDATVSATKGAKKAVTGIKSGDASKYSSKVAQNLLKDIAVESKGADNIENIVKEFDKISNIVGAENYPLIVALSDNQTLMAAFQKTLRGASGAKLRAQLDDELVRLKDTLENKSEELFGSRNLDLVNTEVNLDIKNAAAKADEQVVKIEERLAGLGDRFKEAKDADVGSKIQNLINLKATKVRESLSPKYEEVISAAVDAGATLPPKGTEAIYKFVVQNNLRDIFGKTTAVDKQIMSLLKPKKVVKEPSPIIIPGQPPAKAVETTVYPEITFNNVDSLKRRINELQRNNKNNSDVMRKLNQLEEVVDAQRELIPGGFSDQLRAVDKLFYERMGIPFDNKSIKDLNTKGYVEQVAPVLLTKPSATRQFLETVGPEGQNVVKTTVMSKLYETSVKPDGTIDQKALERNIKKYSEVISQVDGFQDELTDIAARNGFDVVSYKAAIDQRNLAQTDLKAAELLKSRPNLAISFKNAATNLDDPAALGKFREQQRLLDADTQKLMDNRLRREVISQALNKGNALEYLTDPNNRAALTEIMGGKYTNQLQAMAKLSDAIKRADPENTTVFNVEGKFDPLFRKLGVSSEQTFSVVRDRIMSIEQKMAVLLSKANAARMRTAEENALMEVFLDPEGLPKLLAAARESKVSSNNPEGIKKFLSKARTIAGTKLVQYSNGALAREVSRQQAQDEDPLKITVTKPLPNQ